MSQHNNQNPSMELNSENIVLLKELLKREPTDIEKKIFSVLLKKNELIPDAIAGLMKSSCKDENILSHTIANNQHFIDIGNNLVCYISLDSFNQQCKKDPFHGASYGIGTVNMDILAKHATPVAFLNSIKLGNIKNNETKKNLYNISSGLGKYSNMLGVPVFGGELFFDDAYNSWPLVNTMAVGIASLDKCTEKPSPTDNDLIYLVGNIPSFNANSQGLSTIRSSTPVPDSYTGRLLLELITEISEKNNRFTLYPVRSEGVAIALIDILKKNKKGLNINLDKALQSNNLNDAEEILFTESTELLILIFSKKDQAFLELEMEKRDLQFFPIGSISKEKNLVIKNNDALLTNLTLSDLSTPLSNKNNSGAIPEAYHPGQQKFSINDIKEPTDFKEIALNLLDCPNLASKKWVYEQFDSISGGANITTNFPSDAALLNIKGTDSALALTIDCNTRYIQADPETGAMIAVAEAIRNLGCSGAIPSSMSIAINSGELDKAPDYWYFQKMIKGLKKASAHFKIPISSATVSIDNPSLSKQENTTFQPASIIGMAGIVKNKNKLMTLAFKEKGDMIFLLGKYYDDINSSEYLSQIHNIQNTPAPTLNLDEELNLYNLIVKLINKSLIRSAHDVSEGGLFFNLIESALVKNLGFDITTLAEIRKDSFLFGESQGRIVVSVTPDKENDFIDFMVSNQHEFIALGHVTKEEIRIDDQSFGFITDIKKRFENVFKKYL